MATLYYLCRAELIAAINSEAVPEELFGTRCHNGIEGYNLGSGNMLVSFIVNRGTPTEHDWIEADLITGDCTSGVGYALVPRGQKPNSNTNWRRLRCCARTLEGED